MKLIFGLIFTLGLSSLVEEINPRLRRNDCPEFMEDLGEGCVWIDCGDREQNSIGSCGEGCEAAGGWGACFYTCLPFHVRELRYYTCEPQICEHRTPTNASQLLCGAADCFNIIGIGTTTCSESCPLEWYTRDERGRCEPINCAQRTTLAGEGCGPDCVEEFGVCAVPCENSDHFGHNASGVCVEKPCEQRSYVDDVKNGCGTGDCRVLTEMYKTPRCISSDSRDKTQGSIDSNSNSKSTIIIACSVGGFVVIVVVVVIIVIAKFVSGRAKRKRQDEELVGEETPAETRTLYECSSDNTTEGTAEQQ